jgi:hypothetical protein
MKVRAVAAWIARFIPDSQPLTTSLAFSATVNIAASVQVIGSIDRTRVGEIQQNCREMLVEKHISSYTLPNNRVVKHQVRLFSGPCQSKPELSRLIAG